MSWLWDAAQQAASGDYEGAAETASEGAQQTADDAQQAAQDAYDAATDTASDVVDAVTGAASDAASSGEDALAETLPTTISFVGDVVGLAGITDSTQTLTSDLRDRAESGVEGLTEEFLELNLKPPSTNDGLDDSRDLRQSSDERLMELVDTMIENAASLEGDLQDLAAPVTDSANDLLQSGSRLAEELHETNMALIRAMDAEESGDAEPAASHEALTRVGDVTDRLAAASARTLDDYSGGRLSDARHALVRFERDLEARRYDEAVADLERAAERYADAPKVMGVRAGFGDDPVAQLRDVGEVDPARDAAYAELGTKMDTVLDRGREAGATVDPEDLDARSRPGEAPGEAVPSRLDDPVVEAMTDGHLREAALHVRRAAEADRAGRDDEADASTAHARDHGEAVAPTAAAHLIGVADVAHGGHLGETQVSVNEIRRAVEDDDLERAIEHAEEAAGRYEDMVAAARVERVDATTDFVEARHDLTDGHATAGRDAAEQALLLREGGDDTGAREHADRAGDEYEAAVVELDRNIELATREMVGADAPPPAHDAAKDVLDRATAGDLREARTQLDEGARSARSDDLQRAVDSGRRADAHLRDAERSMDDHVRDGSLTRDVAMIRDEHGPEAARDDHDPVVENDESSDDLDFGAGAGADADASRDARGANDDEPAREPTPASAPERDRPEPAPTFDDRPDDARTDEPLLEPLSADPVPGIDDEPREEPTEL